jgi:hypothetical protein
VPWYAVRTVYHFGVKSDGKNVFEERVVCFEASGWPEAHRKADQESGAYAKENKFIAHPEHSGYEQDGQPLINGYELWSELFESNQTLEEFYAERYSKFEYHPE